MCFITLRLTLTLRLVTLYVSWPNFLRDTLSVITLKHTVA